MIRIAVAAVMAIIITGCNRTAAPKPLALEEIPAALSNAFKPARMLVRQNAESIAKQVVEKQYAPATIQLQAMLPQELSSEQRMVASTALMTLNQILEQQAAAAEPAPSAETSKPGTGKEPLAKEESQAAAEVRREYIRTK